MTDIIFYYIRSVDFIQVFFNSTFEIDIRNKYLEKAEGRERRKKRERLKIKYHGIRKRF